jgi:hypothetical protein
VKNTIINKIQNLKAFIISYIKIGLSKQQKWILFLVLFLFYFYFYISSSGVNCSNDSGHLALAKSIYHDHQLSLEKYWQILVFAPDYAVKNKKLYSDRLPGNALCMIPFLAYADFVKFIFPNALADNIYGDIPVAILLPGLCGAIGLYLIFLICFKYFRFRFWISLSVVIMAGLCTLYHLESIHLFSHAPSMMLVMLAVTIALLGRNSVHWKGNLYFISAIIGFATIVELQNILFLIPLFLYLTLKNDFFNFKKIKSSLKIITTSAFIVSLFIGILLFYNYSAFGEIMLKSNKYNPFFTEELSFFTSLSGNFLKGLDHLFTSFNNIPAYTNWSLGIENDTPGILVSNPIFIFSILGFFPFFKKYKEECILFLSLIIISVLIAALHVTTLVRHIFSIHLILFMPIAFFLEWVGSQSQKKAMIWYFVIGCTALFSFFRQSYINNNYFREFKFGEFPYLENSPIFLIINIPLIAFMIYYILFDNGLLNYSKNNKI